MWNKEFDKIQILEIIGWELSSFQIKEHEIKYTIIFLIQ